MYSNTELKEKMLILILSKGDEEELSEYNKLRERFIAPFAEFEKRFIAGKSWAYYKSTV